MTDDSFPPFPFPTNAEPPPMPREKKARKVKEAKATNGRRRRKGKHKQRTAVISAVAPISVPVEKARPQRDDELLSVSKDDILFINGVLQSMQAFPRKQQERIIVALAKVFG